MPQDNLKISQQFRYDNNTLLLMRKHLNVFQFFFTIQYLNSNDAFLGICEFSIWVHFSLFFEKN